MMIIIILIFLGFSSPAFGQIQALTEGSDDVLWAARSDQLLKIGPTSEIVTWYKGSSPIRALLADSNGKDLWVGAEEGLIRCNQGNCRLDVRIPAASVIALAQNSHALWIATNEKFYQIRNNSVTSAALPSNRIEAMAVSREGQVWIGTRTSVQTFRNGSFQEVLKTSAQTIVIEPRTGVVWIGAGHELIRRENGKSESFSLPPPPANVRMRPPITTILPSRSGNVYVGTHGGLLQLSDGTFRKILDEEVLTLFENNKGTLWIGTADGLKKMVAGKISDVPLPE